MARLQGWAGFPAARGIADHVHLIFGLKATHCLADVMRELKKSATNWVHEVQNIIDFRWQEGYAAFTVSPSAVKGVQRYVAVQEEHHRRRTFREELVEMLKRAGVEYDERYLD